VLSGNALKRLGKRFRDGVYSEEDISALEEYRDSFDPALVEVGDELNSSVGRSGIPALMAGRSKRVKSIVRKLQRAENHGMALSKVSDLIGLRVLVENLGQQDEVLELVSAQFDCTRVYDYRTKEHEYRAVHVHVSAGERVLELQIRSLPQHLWASESEAFGERVKEGGGKSDVRSYLSVLSLACARLDEGEDQTEADYDSSLMKARTPLSGRLPDMLSRFRVAARTAADNETPGSFVVIYDRESNRLTQCFEYGPDERSQAVLDYRQKCKFVDGVRFEALILNTTSAEAAAVTHPRFFPEGV
jgi:ppGpp synthetase/RelA/SpoT-type nucleotidyltranferase